MNARKSSIWIPTFCFLFVKFFSCNPYSCGQQDIIPTTKIIFNVLENFEPHRQIMFLLGLVAHVRWGYMLSKSKMSSGLLWLIFFPTGSLFCINIFRQQEFAAYVDMQAVEPIYLIVLLLSEFICIGLDF